MKVIAFNGSPRPEGNTSILIHRVFKTLAQEEIETELVQLGGKIFRGCRACYRCFDNKDQRCSIGNDLVNEAIQKMIAANGIIFGSPTYFADLTPEIKALIDRSGMVGKANSNLYQRKVGAAIVAVRRGGAIHAFDSMNHFFTISQMIIVGSSYWNMGLGMNAGDVEQDTDGLDTMDTLAENMAWLLKKLA